MLEYKEPGDGCLSSHFMVRVKDELGRGDLGLRPLLLRSSEDKVTDSGSRDEASLVLDSFRLLILTEVKIEEKFRFRSV